MFKIAFFNQKGGVGKSTLALAVSSSIAKTGAKVCIVDLDTQRSCLTYAANSKVPEFDVVSSEAELNANIKAGKAYNVVVFDHSPDRGEDNLPHEKADIVVVPFQPSVIDFMSTQTAIRALTKRGQPVFTVKNRVNRRTELTKEFQAIETDYVVYDRSVYARVFSKFTSVYQLEGLSKHIHGAAEAQKEINGLVAAIRKKIELINKKK